MRKHKPRSIPAFTEPLRVSVVDGEVVISGPQWVHAALEPHAARASADRLATAADQAKADRETAPSRSLETKPGAEKRNGDGMNEG